MAAPSLPRRAPLVAIPPPRFWGHLRPPETAASRAALARARETVLMRCAALRLRRWHRAQLGGLARAPHGSQGHKLQARKGLFEELPRSEDVSYASTCLVLSTASNRTCRVDTRAVSGHTLEPYSSPKLALPPRQAVSEPDAGYRHNHSDEPNVSLELHGEDGQESKWPGITSGQSRKGKSCATPTLTPPLSERASSSRGRVFR